MNDIRVVVIGVGNPDRGDDGVGSRVAEAVAQRQLPFTKVLTLNGEGTALLEAWDGVPSVILIDAAVSGKPSGTVTQLGLSARDFAFGERQQSTHGLGVADAIELARILGRLPHFLILYTVEAEQFELFAGLSPRVVAAVPTVADQICDDIRAFLGASADDIPPGK